MKTMNRRELLKQSSFMAGVMLMPRMFAAPPERMSLAGMSPAAMSIVPQAQTRYGTVLGSVETSVFTFKGIPYGSDTSPRRFMAPAPPTPWTGVRETIGFGLRAPQPGVHGSLSPRLGYHLPPEQGPIGEDCLHLNVWTPGLRDGRKRPVMVYIHGGAYSSGSANNDLYDGMNLCHRGDVVFVTLNHRLNLFGFLYLADLAPGFDDSGNAGMLDLVLALEWVRDNIEEFGGDPKRVLIFGQSGGGAKCATLMGMPAAKGLFHRVISMSGQQITASRRESATARTRAVLKELNLPESRIADLRTMPMEQLIQASRAAGYYGPVKDGRNLVRDPFDPDAPPLSAHIPMIMGNTHDETRGLIGGGDPTTFGLTWETLPGRLSVVAQFMGDKKPDEVVRQYRAMYPAYSASDVFFAATTAFRSWRGQVIEAERRAAQPEAAPHTWVYELDWRTPIDGGKWGAPHTLDIPLTLDNVAVADGMTGNGPEAVQLASLMSDTWIAFARTGNPNHKGLPEWRPFDLSKRPTMSFAAQSKLVNDPRGDERRLVEQVPYTQPGT
jgi:para-nitrobenzyl esterase